MAKDEILAFWFGKPDDSEYGKPRQAWFTKDLAFDEEVRYVLRTRFAIALFR